MQNIDPELLELIQTNLKPEHIPTIVSGYAASGKTETDIIRFLCLLYVLIQKEPFDYSSLFEQPDP